MGRDGKAWMNEEVLMRLHGLAMALHQSEDDAVCEAADKLHIAIDALYAEDDETPIRGRVLQEGWNEGMEELEEKQEGQEEETATETNVPDGFPNVNPLDFQLGPFEMLCEDLYGGQRHERRLSCYIQALASSEAALRERVAELVKNIRNGEAREAEWKKLVDGWRDQSDAKEEGLQHRRRRIAELETSLSAANKRADDAEAELKRRFRLPELDAPISADIPRSLRFCADFVAYEGRDAWADMLRAFAESIEEGRKDRKAEDSER